MIRLVLAALLSVTGLTANATPEYLSLTPENLSRMKYSLSLKKMTNNRAGKSWNGVDEGKVELLVTINRAGKIERVEEISLSESDNINNAARNAVRSKHKYPPIPNHIKEDIYKFHVRLTFKH